MQLVNIYHASQFFSGSSKRKFWSLVGAQSGNSGPMDFKITKD